MTEDAIGLNEEKVCPMLLSPAFRAYPWGGNRLRSDFGKQTDVNPLAESWEVSCHEGGLSRVASGEHKGKTLREVLERHPRWIHAHAVKGEEFPILIKLIDAQQTLALQVHPDDEYAGRVEGCMGKTEMWVVMDAAPGAGVYYGFGEHVSREQVLEAMGTDALCGLLAFHEVKPGDAFFIPAGVVHAIGEGLLIAEVQQSSDITYRLYDFGYLGPDGKPREMHIEKGLDVARIEPAQKQKIGVAEHVTGGSVSLLADCEQFSVSKLHVSGEMTLCADASSFQALLCLDGECTLQYEEEQLVLGKGCSAFVPAGLGEYALHGRADVLLAKRGRAKG